MGAAPSGVVTGDVDAPTPTAEPTHARLRRLTHVEYDNTVSDLLGIQSHPSEAFTADVAQEGFTNNALGQSVAPALTEQYVAAAEGLSRTATQDLVGLLGCDPAVGDERACVQSFVQDFGKRAWRRPVTDVEQARLLAVFDEARTASDLATAVQLVVQVFLQAPQFLYLVEPAAQGAAPGSIVALDVWQVASRLSYFLLGSMPDDELLAAAESGALSTPEGVAAQAERLLTLPRAREQVGLFFREWLALRNADRLQKDPVLFPDYDLTVGPMLAQQIELFAQWVILDEGGTATDLLTSSQTFVNPRLAPIYGLEPGSDPGFVRVDLALQNRAGLLTHAGLMATLAKADQTDPVHRGKFVRERLLCQSVPPPPPDANITPPVISPDATTRERFAQHQADPTCAACHVYMDPIGLGFEHYDAIGKWRDEENGLPIDATGEIIAADVEGTFDGALELATQLAASREVMDCFVETWLRFGLGRSLVPGDQGTVAAIGEDFAGSGFVMSQLLTAVSKSRAFRYQLVPDPQMTAFPQEQQ